MTVHQLGLTMELSSLVRTLTEGAVRVLYERRDRTQVIINGNLKLLKIGTTPAETRYLPMAYSSNPNQDRVLADSNAALVINDNAMYRLILMSEGKQDYCLVPDIEEFRKSIVFPFEFPDKDAAKFYKSCLVVAIHGPRSRYMEMFQPEGHVALPFGEKGVLCGFICVDSPNYDVFNKDWDLTVMREIASKAFNAFCLYCASSYALQMRGENSI